ncbi:MAG: hypothetical protein ACOVN0_20100 [Niveispirillum sp.]|uniref:hypothetical protein n=1 Tax=Niveispirillum sp. TaxID=1917217 RepID=UPI003BA4F1DE
MQIANLLLVVSLIIIYGGYMVAKIGSGTLWPPRHLAIPRLALFFGAALVVPWAGQSLVHLMIGYSGQAAAPGVMSWLPQLLLFAPLIETMMVGGVYAVSRVIRAGRVGDALFILVTGAGAALLHRHGTMLMITWYFTFFAAQAAFFVWVLPRLGHVRAILAVTAIHGLGNLGIMASVITTHALRNMG